MKAKQHFCEYEVLSEELNLIACNFCGQEAKSPQRRVEPHAGQAGHELAPRGLGEVAPCGSASSGG